MSIPRWPTHAGVGSRADGEEVEDSEELNEECEAESAGARKRSEPRDSLFLHAVVRRLDDENSIPLRVRNLSRGGLMADCTEVFALDERVELELRGVGVQLGRVAWIAEGKIGIEFDHPINPKLARRPVTVADKSAPQEGNTWRPGLRAR